jgi:hypothetical protein
VSRGIRLRRRVYDSLQVRSPEQGECCRLDEKRGGDSLSGFFSSPEPRAQTDETATRGERRLEF